MYIFTIPINEDNYTEPMLIKDSALNDYILNTEDIKMLDRLYNDSAVLVRGLSSELMAKIGPGAVTKRTLNSLYVRNDNTDNLKLNDLENFYKYALTNFVGHHVKDATRLIPPDHIDISDVLPTMYTPPEPEVDPFDELENFN